MALPLSTVAAACQDLLTIHCAKTLSFAFSQQKELMCQTNPWLVQIFLDLYLKDCLLSRLPCQVCYCLIMLLCGPHWRLRGGAECIVFLTHIPLMVSNIMIMTICAFKPRFISQIYQNGKRGHSPPKPSTNYNAKQDSDTLPSHWPLHRTETQSCQFFICFKSKIFRSPLKSRKRKTSEQTTSFGHLPFTQRPPEYFYN